MNTTIQAGFLGMAVLVGGFAASAQTADQAWLRHGYFHGLPPVPMQVRALGHEQIEDTAVHVLAKGIKNLWGSSPVIGGKSTAEAIVVGTLDQMRSAYHAVDFPPKLSPEAFWIAESDTGGKRLLLIAGGSERGVLYGAFALVRKLSVSGWKPTTKISENPAMPIRWVDEWDNPDGSIERGYAGRSIFFEGGNVRAGSCAGGRVRPPAGLGRHQRRATSTTSMQTRVCWIPNT
jgi:alpha-glucuronidase